MQHLTRDSQRQAMLGRPAPARAPGGRPQPQARPARRDPAPSRLAYRLNRIWLTPLYRRVLRLGVPAFALAMVVGLYLSGSAVLTLIALALSKETKDVDYDTNIGLGETGSL